MGRLVLPSHAGLALNRRAVVMAVGLRLVELRTVLLQVLLLLGPLLVLALVEIFAALLPGGTGLLLLGALVLFLLALLLLLLLLLLNLPILVLHVLLLLLNLLLHVLLLLLNVVLHLLLHVLVLLRTRLIAAALRATLVVVVGQGLGTQGQAEQACASQTPDGRIHGFLTG
jgi:hypothetical protein